MSIPGVKEWALPAVAGGVDRPWFDPVAVIVTAGHGDDSCEEIGAFERALRCGGVADFNLCPPVTSIIPPGLPVCTLPAGAQVLSGNGHMVPAVSVKAPSRDLGVRVTAGIGLGVPRDRTRCGIIFPIAESGLEVADCRARLEAVVDEGMLLRSPDYDFKYVIGTTVVRTAGRWYAAMATLCFADAYMWRHFYEQLAEPLQ
jgi:pyruvoyl-dependent arginine decarboxylase